MHREEESSSENSSLIEENKRLKNEISKLRQSVLNQCGDNLCWIDPANPPQILPKEQFLQSCERYHAQVSKQCGTLAIGQMTIAQLEARVLELEIAFKNIQKTTIQKP